LLTLGLLFVAASWAARRTDWSTVPPLPIRRRRRAGQIIRAGAKSYRRSLRALITFGAIYVPTAVVVALFGGLVSVAPFVGTLRDLAGPSSGTSLVLGIFAGSAASAAAYVAVNAMVAVYADNLDSETPISAHDAALQTWARRNHLASGFVRAYAIVMVLLISVVGIPWGIRQVVRYQFLAQAVMLDGCDGKQGLRRSSELVEGRWWHTAVVTGALNAFVAGSGLLFGLTLLLVLPSLPLWLFSAISTLAYAIVVPLAAMAMTLLYGDAVAEQEGIPLDEPALV